MAFVDGKISGNVAKPELVTIVDNLLDEMVLAYARGDLKMHLKAFQFASRIITRVEEMREGVDMEGVVDSLRHMVLAVYTTGRKPGQLAAQ